jgi:hypothetical protein
LSKSLRLHEKVHGTINGELINRGSPPHPTRIDEPELPVLGVLNFQLKRTLRRDDEIESAVDYRRPVSRYWTSPDVKSWL